MYEFQNGNVRGRDWVVRGWCLGLALRRQNPASPLPDANVWKVVQGYS